LVLFPLRDSGRLCRCVTYVSAKHFTFYGPNSGEVMGVFAQRGRTVYGRVVVGGLSPREDCKSSVPGLESCSRIVPKVTTARRARPLLPKSRRKPQ
jgi:hypothetical protein